MSGDARARHDQHAAGIGISHTVILVLLFPTAVQAELQSEALMQCILGMAGEQDYVAGPITLITVAHRVLDDRARVKNHGIR